MAGVNQVFSLADDVARYVKACGKRSILECKPLQGKINPKGLGVVFLDGKINFQNEESALKYIKARLHDALNRPQAEQFERVIAKRGSTIIGEGDGTHTDATKAFQCILNMPFFDATATSLAFLAQVLTILRFKENWTVWIVTDVICIIMWTIRGDWCIVTQYLFWIINALYGHRMWTKNTTIE